MADSCVCLARVRTCGAFVCVLLCQTTRSDKEISVDSCRQALRALTCVSRSLVFAHKISSVFSSVCRSSVLVRHASGRCCVCARSACGASPRCARFISPPSAGCLVTHDLLTDSILASSRGGVPHRVRELYRVRGMAQRPSKDDYEGCNTWRAL